MARVVVIGAGILGLATAYNLAKRGVRDVLVVDRTYLCGGASGRNGGGVRAQFSSEINIRLMRESIAICRDFATEMKINVWFRQGGYLFLARSAERARALEENVALQNRCGLPTRMVDAAEMRKIVPELATEGVRAASFNPGDGVVFPWPFVWGYARAATDLGVTIKPFTEVVGFETRNGRITGVRLRPTRLSPLDASDEVLPAGDAFTEECNEVVICAGAWSPKVAELLGVALPNKPHRHEICATEPLKPWLGPLVADLSDGLYFSQSMRGEIVGGVAVDPVPEGINQQSSLPFLTTLIGVARASTCTIASGAQGWRHRPQPVQAALSMRTKARSTSRPLAFLTRSRRVTWIAGQPTSTQLPQPVHLSSITRYGLSAW